MRKWSGLELFPVVSPTLINNRPIRTVRDLADHVFCMAMTAANGTPGWPPPTGSIWSAAAATIGDARTATEAAVHGHGVALGDSVTASQAARQGPAGRAVQPVGAGGR